MKYQIRSVGYDPESDEMDLLVDSASPQPAESIPLDAGIYIRREFETGKIVGAFIRGYHQFALDIAAGKSISDERAQHAGLAPIFHAILDWQREVGTLSHELAEHLGGWHPQDALMQILIES